MTVGIHKGPMRAMAAAVTAFAVLLVMSTDHVWAASDNGSGAAVSSPALSQAAALAATCSGCHGVDAGPEGTSLRTLKAEEIQTLMATFRRETGGFTVMHRLARGYTDAQIALIARHIASSGGG